MELVPVGRDAVLVELGSSEEAVSLAAWARSRGAARDVVAGATTVLLDGLEDGLVDGLVDGGGLPALLAQWRADDLPAGPQVEIPMTYDGPDLEDVAERWACSVEEVVARHQTTEFVAAFCGFAPGFAYLRGLAVEVPRLGTPRPRVVAGSVGLAARWCGVYPTDSPGGWRVIGHTDVTLWDVRRDPPALLAPGTRVRFRDAS